MKHTMQFLKSIKASSNLFWELCNLDLKQRTAGSIFGLFWTYFSPLLSIAIIWFVFHFGLKGNSGSNDIYSLLIGLIAWQLISDAILTGIGAFSEKPYLVKKIKFPLELLPIIKVTNSFRIHMPFLFLVLIMSIISGHFSYEKVILFIFVSIFIFTFLAALVLFLSTAVVFYKDLQNAVGIVMQLLFWGTPIIWKIPEWPTAIEYIEKFNPFYFVIKTYRYCFLEEIGDISISSAIFFIATVLLVLIATKTFYVLKDQFADVL